MELKHLQIQIYLKELMNENDFRLDDTNSVLEAI